MSDNETAALIQAEDIGGTDFCYQVSASVADINAELAKGRAARFMLDGPVFVRSVDFVRIVGAADSTDNGDYGIEEKDGGMMVLVRLPDGIPAEAMVRESATS